MEQRNPWSWGGPVKIGSSEPDPEPTPVNWPELPAEAWDRHDDADAWLEAANAAVGEDVTPEGWGDMTLAEKFSAAQVLVDAQ